MKNIFELGMFVLFILITGSVFPQTESVFTDYSGYTEQEFAISCKLPKGFEIRDSNKPWWIRKENHSNLGMIYGPILQSSDKKCILMYPLVPWYISEDDVALSKILAKVDRKVFNDTSRKESNLGANENFSRNQIATEMSAALGISKALRDSLFVFDDHVTRVSGKTVREMFNADTIYFYDIPLEDPYMNDYVYCTGMLVSKYGRATMILKWFFTEEGKKSEFEYLKLLEGNIWYDKWERPESRFIKADR